MKHSQTSFNEKYNFDFKSIFTTSHVFNQSYIIQFTVQSTFNISLLPLETGIPVIITVTLNKNSASVDFTRRVIPSSLIVKKYKITMILTHIGGRTEFVLAEKQDEFYFSSRESSLKQIIRFINQVIYDSIGIYDNSIKMILFTQNL